MALNLSRAKIDTARSTQGRWIMLSEEGGGEALVARWDNPEFRALQAKLQQEYRRPAPGRRHIKGRTIPPEITEAITFRLVVETILLDWRNIDKAEGEPFPYSKENAGWLLSQEEYRWIYDEIVNAALDEAAYRAETEEEDAENLSRSLNGNLPTEKTGNG